MFGGSVDKFVKGRGVFDRSLREHFSVEQNAGTLQSMNEHAVPGSSHPARSRDASNPETSIVTLAVAPVAIGESACPHEGDLGLLLVTASSSVIPTGFPEHPTTPLCPRGTLSNAWHASLLYCLGGGSYLRGTLWSRRAHQILALSAIQANRGVFSLLRIGATRSNIAWWCTWSNVTWRCDWLLLFLLLLHPHPPAPANGVDGIEAFQDDSCRQNWRNKVDENFALVRLTCCS